MTEGSDKIRVVLLTQMPDEALDYSKEANVSL